MRLLLNLLNCVFRNQDNLDGWNNAMGDKTDVRFCLFLNCPLSVCEERIMERAKTSGRADDNIGGYINYHKKVIFNSRQNLTGHE